MPLGLLRGFRLTDQFVMCRVGDKSAFHMTYTRAECTPKNKLYFRQTFLVWHFKDRLPPVSYHPLLFARIHNIPISET